jgi:hypothetical protein
MKSEREEQASNDGMAPSLDPEVTAHLDAMRHPLRKELELLRRIILGADPTITEGLKWNTASFRTTEWFATLNGPRQTEGPAVILHAGAKARGLDLKDRITDPDGLLEWLAKDRARITFRDATELMRRQDAMVAILKEWILHL